MERLSVAEALKRLHMRGIFFPPHESEVEGLIIRQLYEVAEVVCSREYTLKNLIVINNTLLLEFGMREQDRFTEVWMIAFRLEEKKEKMSSLALPMGASFRSVRFELYLAVSTAEEFSATLTSRHGRELRLVFPVA